MRVSYRLALALLAVGATSIVLTASGVEVGVFVLIGASATPLAVGCMLCGRFGRSASVRALVLGGTVGVGVSILTEPLVAGFVAAFVQGFANSGRQLIDSLRVDPRLTSVLASPWVLVLLVEVALVAPLTEELGKALGAGLARPGSRDEAFLFGAWAGVGFAIVENLVYAGIGAAVGGGWPIVALSRSLGSAANPLATGLVMLGWWEWHERRRVVDLARGYLAGVGVHALWNASLVALGVVVATLAVGSGSATLKYTGLVYSALLGVVMAGALWSIAGAVAEGRDPLLSVDLRRARSVAALTLVSASILVPVAILVLAFPQFYRG